MGLTNTDPKKGGVFPASVAVVLLVLVVALGVSVLIVMWPAKDWSYVPSATTILQKTDAGESEAAIRRHVINAMVNDAKANQTKLKRKQNAFRSAVVLLVVEVALLVGALALQLKGMK